MSTCHCCNGHSKYSKCNNHLEYNKNNCGCHRKHGLHVAKKKCKLKCKVNYCKKNNFNYDCHDCWDNLKCKKISKYNYFVNTHGLISDHCPSSNYYTIEHVHDRKCCYKNSVLYYSGIIEDCKINYKCTPNVHCKYYYY